MPETPADQSECIDLADSPVSVIETGEHHSAIESLFSYTEEEERRTAERAAEKAVQEQRLKDQKETQDRGDKTKDAFEIRLRRKKLKARRGEY